MISRRATTGTEFAIACSGMQPVLKRLHANPIIPGTFAVINLRRAEMRIETTSATGLFGAMIFSSWELLKVFEPTSVSTVQMTHQAAAGPIQVASKDRDKVKQDGIALEGSSNDNANENYQNLQKKVKMLKDGRDFIKSKSNYTATLDKREVVRGELLDEQSIEMKVRLKPFSVYLLWNTGDTGREVIYIEGQNNGKMVAHDGGWKARLPAFCLEPECTLAMRDARYPVTSAGLIVMIDTMLDAHEKDLNVRNIKTCEMTSDDQFDGRPAVKVTTYYQSKETSPTYRKSITLFDQQTSIPVSTEHFEWCKQGKDVSESALDETTLVERYSFHGLSFDEELTDKDFDRSNPHYHFR